MNTELELVKVHLDKIRWMISQLENSCDGTKIMLDFIIDKKAQLGETLDRIAFLSK